MMVRNCYFVLAMKLKDHWNNKQVWPFVHDSSLNFELKREFFTTYQHFFKDQVYKTVRMEISMDTYLYFNIYLKRWKYTFLLVTQMMINCECQFSKTINSLYNLFLTIIKLSSPSPKSQSPKSLSQDQDQKDLGWH